MQTVFTVNLLISPSRKWPNNSDILNQRGEAGGGGTRRYARLSSSVWGGGVSLLISRLTVRVFVFALTFLHLDSRPVSFED